MLLRLICATTLVVCFSVGLVSADQPTTSIRAAKFVVRKHKDLETLEQQVKKASKKARAATVSVRVGRGNRGGYAFGSGVLVSKDGYVLTAAHVSSRPDQEVVFTFEDGTTAQGVTLGLHQDLDIGFDENHRSRTVALFDSSSFVQPKNG